VGFFQRVFFLCAVALLPGAPLDAAAKSAANKNPPASAVRPHTPAADDTAIPLPRDLTDNSDPFDAGGSSTTSAGSRYFQEQQNFREQDPTRDQEGSRIIRQFE